MPSYVLLLTPVWARWSCLPGYHTYSSSEHHSALLSNPYHYCKPKTENITIITADTIAIRTIHIPTYAHIDPITRVNVAGVIRDDLTLKQDYTFG